MSGNFIPGTVLQEIENCKAAQLLICLNENSNSSLKALTKTSTYPTDHDPSYLANLGLLVTYIISLYHSIRSVRDLAYLKRVHPLLCSMLKLFHVSSMIGLTFSGLLLLHEKYAGFQGDVNMMNHLAGCRIHLWLIRMCTIVSNWSLVICLVLRFLHISDPVFFGPTLLKSRKLFFYIFMCILCHGALHKSKNFYYKFIGACYDVDIYYCRLIRESYRNENHVTLSFTIPAVLICISFAFFLPSSYPEIQSLEDYRHCSYPGQDEMMNIYSRKFVKRSIFAFSSVLLSFLSRIPLTVYVVCGDGCFSPQCFHNLTTSWWWMFVFFIFIIAYFTLHRLFSTHYYSYNNNHNSPSLRKRRLVLLY